MTEKGPTPADCDLIIYDTTMATNALIESKGAKTPTLTTEGMGDAVEIAYESRFELFSGSHLRGYLGAGREETLDTLTHLLGEGCIYTPD